MLSSEDLGVFRMVLEQYRQEHNVAALEMAAALARMVQGDEPLLLAADVDHGQRAAERRPKEQPFTRRDERREPMPTRPGKGMERFRVEVGHNHGIQPGNLVGAITNEASLSGTHIGRIDIFDEYSTLDLPEGMRHELFDTLKKVRGRGQRLRLSSLDGERKHGDKHKHGGKRKKDRHRNRKKRGKWTHMTTRGEGGERYPADPVCGALATVAPDTHNGCIPCSVSIAGNRRRGEHPSESPNLLS